MTKTKEILLKVLDVMINLSKRDEARTIKDDAVRKGDFEAALKWRQKENEINASLPSIADAEEWKKQLETAEDEYL